MQAARLGVAILAILLLLVTAAPLVRTDAWWVRIFDFPRTQIAVLVVLCLIAWAILGPRGIRGWGLALGLLAAGLYQGARMFPYSPLARPEMLAASCAPESRLRVAVANVLMTNRDAPTLLRILREADPDVILLAEADSWWDGQLAALDAGYPHAVKHPLGNTYGMHLFSRLELRDATVRALVEEDVPSVRAAVRLRSGAWIDFHGIHPRPPAPGQDSEARDAELLVVGREVMAAGRPAVVAGDMNDVAWSSTTRLFQRISGTLDPRIGRGMYATFPATLPAALRWPLDHIFATPHFALSALRRLPRFGSDHLPMLAELCLRPDLAPAQSAEPAREEGRERARETIREGREEN